MLPHQYYSDMVSDKKYPPTIMLKKIYIGSSNFAKIISFNGLFIDKSLFIKEIIEDTSDVILITRPRRFGKTLNMSMLHHFFAAKTDFVKTTIGLFDQLAIAKESAGLYIKEYQGKYPVIFVTFKDIKASNYQMVLEQLSFLLQEVFASHRELLKSEHLDELDKLKFSSYLELGIFSATKIDVGLRLLSQLLYKHYRQQVVILVDEYDTPLNAAYVAHYIDELTPLMRNLMSNTFKDNNVLYKGVMTGILRISKDSMLSGLNNLKVFTILDARYKEYFGFINEELDELYKTQEISGDKAEIKKWYNGYKFANLEIYNPWSILNCISNQGQFDEYWVHTSDNKMIENLLLKFREDVHPQVTELMESKVVKVIIDHHITYSTLDVQSSSLWSLLLFSGYLTAEKTKTTDELLYECDVRLPNREIVHLLNYCFRFWLNTRIGTQYQSFLDNLVTGNIEKFSEQLNTYLLEALSVRDTGYTSEKFYHGLVLGLIASLRATHVVHSNRESGDGYPDVIIYPVAHNTQHDLGIVMEFKHAKEDGSENMDLLASKALKQITKKNYATELKSQPQVKRILMLGLAFNHKQVIVEANQISGKPKA